MKRRRLHWDKFNQPDFIARLRANDEKAYRELDTELCNRFTVYVHRKFGIPEQDAKDIVQEATMNIYRKIRLFQPAKGGFVIWAFRILRNCCLDWLKKRKKERLTFRELLTTDEAIATEGKDLHDDLSPLERLPFEVQEAILKLPGRYQQLIGLMLLSASEDYIRGIIQINTRSTFRSLKSRVLTKLQTEVQQSMKEANDDQETPTKPQSF